MSSFYLTSSCQPKPAWYWKATTGAFYPVTATPGASALPAQVAKT